MALSFVVKGLFSGVKGGAADSWGWYFSEIYVTLGVQIADKKIDKIHDWVEKERKIRKRLGQAGIG